MTGYTVHTGTTIRFSEGWDRIFQGDQDSTGKPAKSTKKGAKMKGSAAAKSRQTKASKIRRAKGQ